MLFKNLLHRNQCQFLQHNLLHAACDYSESPKVVEALVTEVTDINSTFGGGNTPLMSSVLCEDLASCLIIASLLLATKCNVN